MPLPSPGDLLNPGSNPSLCTAGVSHIADRFFTAETPGKPVVDYICRNLFLDSPFCSIGHLSPDRRKSSLVDETPGEEIYDN